MQMQLLLMVLGIQSTTRMPVFVWDCTVWLLIVNFILIILFIKLKHLHTCNCCWWCCRGGWPQECLCLSGTVGFHIIRTAQINFMGLSVRPFTWPKCLGWVWDTAFTPGHPQAGDCETHYTQLWRRDEHSSHSIVLCVLSQHDKHKNAPPPLLLPPPPSNFPFLIHPLLPPPPPPTPPQLGFLLCVC